MRKGLFNDNFNGSYLSLFPDLQTEQEPENSSSAIIRREDTDVASAESDLFDRARIIYLRGRRRYTRKASGII